MKGGGGGGGGGGWEGFGSKLFSFRKCLVMTLLFYELIDLKLNKQKPKGKQNNERKKTLNVLKDPSQPHLCYCLQYRIWDRITRHTRGKGCLFHRLFQLSVGCTKASRARSAIRMTWERARGVMGRRKIGREKPAKSCIEDLRI